MSSDHGHGGGHGGGGHEAPKAEKKSGGKGMSPKEILQNIVGGGVALGGWFSEKLKNIFPAFANIGKAIIRGLCAVLKAVFGLFRR